MSIYSFKMYEWRYFTARGSCDHLKMLSVLCVYPCVFHLSTLMLVCIPVLGMPDFQLFVPSFLNIQEIINLSALWLYSHVDLIGKHSSYVISSYLSIRHLQGLHNGATLESTYQWGFQESLIHDQSPWWLVHPYTMALLAVHHQYLGFNNTRVCYFKMSQEYHTQLCVCVQNWHKLGSASNECSLQTYDLEKEEIPNFQVQGPTVSLVWHQPKHTKVCLSSKVMRAQLLLAFLQPCLLSHQPWPTQTSLRFQLGD